MFQVTGEPSRASSGAHFSSLWVCFEPPERDPPPHALVLSFVGPGDEAAMEERFGAQIASGRLLIQEVRQRARHEYVSLIARLGSTPVAAGRTLRQVMLTPEGYSRWWFLSPTEKDCIWDDDTIYTTILRLMAVQFVTDRYHIGRVQLYGASRVFAASIGQLRLSTFGAIVEVVREVMFGLAGRVALIFEYLRYRRALPDVASPAEHRDVLLQSYWDWSVRPAGDGLRDRYFTTLPAELASRGLSVGWLASCEPHAERSQEGRRSRDVVASSRAHPDVTLLERYLKPYEIVRLALDVGCPLRVTRVVIDSRFRHLCRVGESDVYPLVRTLLLRATWGATVCRLQLVATASARACRQLRPRIMLTAFEMFMRSRAIYAGLRACDPHVPVWAAQHAGYSSDKTLGVYDPEIEMRGTPDGCGVPAPDGIFVMGDLSRRLWEDSGFEREQVLPTGGLRYQAVRAGGRADRPRNDTISLLIVGGMNEAAELDVCEAAVAATAGLDAVRIHWRDHPNYRFSARAVFRRFHGVIAVTSGTVEEDLDAADLVLFTHTGLAEEALLRGVPTWQWLWPGFNTSPFLDVPVIPSFVSVADLRGELRAFLEAPSSYRPSEEVQQRVLTECFGLDPEGASVRMADAIERILGAGTGERT